MTNFRSASEHADSQRKGEPIRFRPESRIKAHHMARQQVSLERLFALLEGEYGKARPALCRACVTPLPIRRIPADEVSTKLGTRLLGTIPPLTAPGRPATAGAQSNLIEAIDTTRIMLTHGSPLAGDLRVLLVTSALSGEGKTTLSGNLAISLTRAGFRTLLVDGDTCAPTAHNLFGLTETPGLGELLRDEADADDAVRPSQIPGLSILPAGSWTPATHQMLVGDRWRRLKRELKSKFDFVVIDTSPLLLVPDTLLMAREADGVVVSVLIGISQIERVAETVNRLQAVGANDGRGGEQRPHRGGPPRRRLPHEVREPECRRADARAKPAGAASLVKEG